jgi:hypothetical protein
MKRYFEFFVAATALVIVAVAIAAMFRLADKSQIQQANLEKEFEEADSTTVADVQQRLEAHLSALPADDPIVGLLGPFVAIEGTGYSRSGDPLENRPITLNRQIEFRKATVPCLIKVSARGTLKFDVELLPRKSGDSRKEDQSGQPRLVVSVTHPRYSINTSVFQDTVETNDSVTDIFETFVQGVDADDQQQLTKVRQWYDSQREGKSTEAFLRLAIAHPDEAVRLKAVEFISTPSRGGRVHFSDSMMKELLIAVEDESQPVAVRQQLVFTLLKESEPYRADLYQLLRDLGDKASFAVKPISEFIVDRSQRHWARGGGFDAPIGAVELLQAWGSDAKEAAPALLVVMREHPNHGAFALAAARALGTSGVESPELIAELQLATTAGSVSLREAATEALKRMFLATPSIVGEPLRFAKPETREAFYPLDQNKTYSWLSEDSESVMFAKVDYNTVTLYQADLHSASCEQVLRWEGENICSVAGQGNEFVVLRVHDAGETQTLFADTWSTSPLKRTKITTVCLLRPDKPGQKMTIGDVHWSEDRNWVSFVAMIFLSRDRTRSSEPATWRRTSAKQGLQIKSIDQPNPFPDKRLSEYLMMPVGFSTSGKEVYSYGWCFEKKAHLLGVLDLETREIVKVFPDKKNRTGLQANRGDHDWIVTDHQSSRSGASIELFDPHANLNRTFTLSDAPAFYQNPFEIAVAFANGGQRVAVVTQSSVDVFDTETATLVSQRPLLWPKSLYKVHPIFLAADDDGFVLAMTRGSGPQRNNPSSKNELRLVRIGIDQEND